MFSRERRRLANQGKGNVPLWHLWGPYVAERSWGTVREDYGNDNDPWRHFPFEQAHQRVYRWGEDGIAGWCDRYQTLVFTPAFWNGQDPILKERLFGVSSHEGNHGEDVKEFYYYLDATPTHSYMKYLYKYPQRAFPYQQLIDANATRDAKQTEYELIDTGIFDNNKYFDIFIEYAKEAPEDIYIRIEAFNRGDESAPLHILPQLFFRNQWSWGKQPLPQPRISNDSWKQHNLCLFADDALLLSPPSLDFDYHLGSYYLYGTSGGEPLFTNNENPAPGQLYYKDAFHRAIIHRENSVNRQEEGTKACIHYYFESVPPGQSVVVYLRLVNHFCRNPLEDAEKVFEKRKKEADEFYQSIHPPKATQEERLIQRQALAGMIWTKQIYLFDVNIWFKGDNPDCPPPPERVNIRNTHWRHLNSMRVLSMPDKWEYPWFAAWDLAFHCITLGLVDIEFAKEQLWLLLFEQFQHPNGSIPAYEWEFSDLNPPVQAWAAYRLYKMGYEQTGQKDFNFLKKCYLKLIMNFAFWVNKVDSSGCNVFEGGFLGLDNITILDRSKFKGTGALLKQADGTGWMAMFSLNLMRIALELAQVDPTYEFMATKFFQHFIYISYAMQKIDNKKYNLWSDRDGFYYDALVQPDGSFTRLRVRSLVGMIPFFAIDMFSESELNRFPEFRKNFLWFLNKQKNLTADHVTYIPDKKLYILSLPNQQQLQSLLHYLNDPNEFLSPYGIRSLSKFHEQHPFVYEESTISYEPGDSTQRMKGGNSNWRGPIWFPINYLLIESLKMYALVLPEQKIAEITETIANRLINLFKKDVNGKRPYFADFYLANDHHFNDYLWFNEFFHAETGKGLGASHQTGWTGLVANLIDEFRK